MVMFKKIAVTISAVAFVMLAVALDQVCRRFSQPFARPRQMMTPN